MSNDHTSVEVARIPPCDIDATHGDAYADAQVPGGSSWGYVCRACFDERGCALGLGRGQRLELRVPRETREEHEEAEGWDYDPADHR
jgi:hypothetical protein